MSSRKLVCCNCKGKYAPHRHYFIEISEGLGDVVEIHPDGFPVYGQMSVEFDGPLCSGCAEALIQKLEAED